MTTKPKVVLLGSGNIASHISIMLKNINIKIHQFYNINQKSVEKLALLHKTNYTTNITEIDENADFYIIAVTDSEIIKTISLLKINNGIIMHTSGTTNINIFKNNFRNYGVLYPLQTFSKNVEVNYNEIPFFIEANNSYTLTKIKNFTNLLTNNIVEINSKQRMVLHLSAVFACNFTNQLYIIAETLLEDNNLDFEHLKPLINETTRKALNNSPKKSQTGPAKRNDTKIMNKHTEYLDENNDYKELYKLLSKIINKS